MSYAGWCNRLRYACLKLGRELRFPMTYEVWERGVSAEEFAKTLPPAVRS